MTQFQKLHYLLRKLQYSDGPAEAVTALKNVATAVQVGDKSDIEEVLALLNSTPDHELKVKLLSILSVYLISHNTFCDVIVTYRPLYETIQNLLSPCLPVKTKTTLNFILALLTTDTETNNLKMFCRTMLRVSGCLISMCDIFSNGMMYQDTWIALCQSIAESCSGCEVNQSFCSPLIPGCVERCCLGNTDVFIVLQCLVCNHQRNIQLLFESGGQYIFTRQLLQHDTCMQMLSNIVRTSEQGVQFVHSSGLIHHLRDFLHLYGPYSQIGQWSTIILYHLDNRIKGSENKVKNMANETHGALEHSSTMSKQISYGNVTEKQVGKKYMDHITKDATTVSTIGQQKRNSVYENVEKIYTTKEINKAPIDDDTMNLFQNVIKEIISWKSTSEINPKTPVTQKNKTFKCHQNESQYCNNDRAHKLQNTELNAQFKNNLSFSELLKDTDGKKEVPVSFNTNKYFDEKGQMSDLCLNFTKESNNLVTTGFKRNVKKTTSAFQYSKEKHSEIDLIDFKPSFVSTPKRQHLNRNSSIQSKLQNTTKTSYAGQTERLYRSRIDKQHKINKSKITQTALDRIKDVKQRSMSARFFSAINDSCTTLVKSVKNIFTSKKDIKKNKNSNSGNSDKIYKDDSCNYSFTNYMRKRDAILGNKDIQTEKMEYDDSNSIYMDSCRTCKDTIVLQQKMATDKHLQQTIKRLKIGVKLYGCNFKKISKTLWPRSSYMTPNTLYNLYRKLIINGGHQKQEFPEKY